MNVCIRDRDRCRLCFTLIQHERAVLSSSTCCQRSSNLFQKLQRKSLPNKNSSSSQIKSNRRNVSFYDLIRRYLRIDISSADPHPSQWICSQCSVNLLNIEQCAKYLRKNIQQLKTKLNKSNQLFTSSLSVKFQKKSDKNENSTIQNEFLTKPNSDTDDEEGDDEFNDIDDEEDSEDEQDEEIQGPPAFLNARSELSGSDFLLNNTNRKPQVTNLSCNGGDDDEDEEEVNDELDDGDEDEDEHDHNSGKVPHPFGPNPNQRSAPMFINHNKFNTSDPAVNLLDEKNSQMAQLRVIEMMANLAALSSSGTMNNGPNHGNNLNPAMAAIAAMQRDLFMKFMPDKNISPAAHVPATASANTVNAMNSSSFEGVSRKRKSTPGKRVTPMQKSAANNGHVSINDENPSKMDPSDYPLALTLKNGQRTEVAQNLTINTKGNNGTNERNYQSILAADQDSKDSTTPNDLSMSLSSSFTRRSTSSKKQRTPTNSQLDSFPTLNHASMVNATQSISTDLSSLNQTSSTMSMINDDSSGNAAQHRQQRKLDPRTCSECNKVLFNDKLLLLHGQTHAKNEKQCWICGAHDDDMKKHIINEHGNQKLSTTGFKCQHCEQSFRAFVDLEAHMKEHSKKKPFECHICHKRFGQQGNLSCHLRIHSGVKPFTCSSCGKAFRHSNSLRRHARTVHSATRSLNSSSSSLVADTNLSFNHDSKQENFDDTPSALMIASDDGSSSTGGIPSPSMSNLPMDNDSSEPSEMH